jgi:replicative DNA helicase
VSSPTSHTLAQLSRASEEVGRPRLSHLRESGAIEADADVVLLMHRPAETRGAVEVIIAKQRNGPVGEVTLSFVKEFGRFANYAPDAPLGEV